MRHNPARTQLAIVSTYLPRRCGLATYTTDLREALGVATADLDTAIVAIDRDGLRYAEEVLLTISQDQIEDYGSAAETLSAAGIEVVLIEHEYGIFGGPDGSHLLELTRGLTAAGIPYLVTLHTVLSAPSPGQAATLRALCAGADRVTVFTETARRFAVRTGVASTHQLVVVPHGAPVALRSAPDPAQLRPAIAQLVAHLRGKPTMTTFGLLSEGKGIDLAIEALAEVAKIKPETQYVVAGATHPEVQRHHGESYRERLRQQVIRLNLTDNVHFIDAFLGIDDLSAILHASTLFVTPYRSAEQVCSGALTFALAAGLPVVSSAYRYAEDMLASGAGRVVPIGAGLALSEAILTLLTDAGELRSARDAAQAIAGWLPWPTVAAREAELVREVVARARTTRVTHPPLVAPPLVLDHLGRMTDEIGILQFAKRDVPDPASGYCVDDVARLAIVATDLLAVGYGPGTAQGGLAYRWLRQSVRFLSASYHPAAAEYPPGAMHNQLSYHGTWEDWPHHGDHVGRAMWGMGVVAGTPAVPAELREIAGTLLDTLAAQLMPILAAGQRPELGLRTAAYALLGLARAGRREAAAPLVGRLDQALLAVSDQDQGWRWFEPALTYDNARLPQALLTGAVVIGDEAAAGRALDALEWYADHLRMATSPLRCVGNGWRRRDDDPERWSGEDGDEQPIDAGAVAEAFAEAWRYRADPQDAALAAHGLSWFLGRNRVGTRLYVDRTGGCHDGLSLAGANGNQGAESTLAYYQALLALVRAGLAMLPEPSSPLGGTNLTSATSIAPATERTLAGRATTRPVTTERSSAPSSASPPNRSATGHRTRLTEGHTDAR